MNRAFLVTPVLNPRMIDPKFLVWGPNLFLGVDLDLSVGGFCWSGWVAFIDFVS